VNLEKHKESSLKSIYEGFLKDGSKTKSLLKMLSEKVFKDSSRAETSLKVSKRFLKTVLVKTIV